MLICKGSNKKQRSGSIISNFTKGETFCLLWQPSALGVISQCFCTLQKRPSSPIQFGEEENIPGHLIERRAYWFVLKMAWFFPIFTGRVGIG